MGDHLLLRTSLSTGEQVLHLLRSRACVPRGTCLRATGAEMTSDNLLGTRLHPSMRARN